MHIAEEWLTLDLSLPVSRPRLSLIVCLQVGTDMSGKSDLFLESEALVLNIMTYTQITILRGE
jgi:hypothetical protein